MEEEFNVTGSGQRDVDLRGLTVVAKQRVQIAAVLGENKAHDIVTGEEGFAGPFADEERERVGIRIAVAGEELRVLENDGDFEAGLIGSGDGGEIRGVTEEDGEQLDGGAGMFAGEFGTVRPAGEEVAAALDANAIPDVVSEDDVVTRDDALGDELREGGQVLFIGREEIVGVAGEDELIAGMAVVEIDNAMEPRRQSGSGAHSF